MKVQVRAFQKYLAGRQKMNKYTNISLFSIFLILGACGGGGGGGDTPAPTIAAKPVFTSSASFSAADNQTALGTVTATDSDSSSVTFTVSGSELSITSGGVLSFVTAPDYETKNSYTATVTASDGTNTTTQDVTVSVTLVVSFAVGEQVDIIEVQ